jgi:hypothetical protein
MSQGQSAVGHQVPEDSGSKLQGVAFQIRQILAKYDTMKLVKVIAVHAGSGDPPAAGTVDVQPLVSQIDGNGNTTAHGTVPGIPWSRIQGGKNAIVCDPVVGDVGWVVAADRDTSAVRNTKAVGPPGSRRRFNIADGIYAGGCLNAAPTCYIEFTTDGHFKIVDVDGNMLQSSATGWTATPKSGQPFTISGSLVVTQNLQLGGTVESVSGGLYAGNIHIGGTLTADTDVLAAGKSGKTHQHQVTGGVGSDTTGPI